MKKLIFSLFIAAFFITGSLNAVTNIKRIINNTSMTISIINLEHRSDSLSVNPKQTTDIWGMWIPWGDSQPIEIHANSDPVYIYEESGKLFLRKKNLVENEYEDILLKRGTGGEITLIIDEGKGLAPNRYAPEMKIPTLKIRITNGY